MAEAVPPDRRTWSMSVFLPIHCVAQLAFFTGWCATTAVAAHQPVKKR
jgi:hypothetical protein